MSEATVYIIDDDPSARRGLTRMVRAAGFHAMSFASAQDFLESGQCDEPGCIILDVRMPEMTGPELQEELEKADCRIPIIFLSGHGDVPTAARAMKNGAVDFLTKPVDKNDLLEAIRVSLAKDIENSRQQTEINSLREQFESLTSREFEVMTYVITGILNKQIADELGITEDTVKIHRGRAMQKLGIVSVAELVRICEKVGVEPAKTEYR
jgi:FixJ family two-component response regulator